MFVENASPWVSVREVTTLFLHSGKGGDNVHFPDGRGCVTGRFLELGGSARWRPVGICVLECCVPRWAMCLVVRPHPSLKRSRQVEWGAYSGSVSVLWQSGRFCMWCKVLFILLASAEHMFGPSNSLGRTRCSWLWWYQKKTLNTDKSDEFWSINNNI